MRILDSALVAAAVLSHRYIADRFLPDKAIDLVDEAAAKLRMEITSMPVELDEAERRIMQLEIEREALRKERDDASRARLEALEGELASLKEQRDALRSRWDQEREAIQQISELRNQLDQTRTQIEQAQRSYDYNTAAEIAIRQARPDSGSDPRAGGGTGEAAGLRKAAQGRSRRR